MSDKVFVQNDDEKIELTGNALTNFLAEQNKLQLDITNKQTLQAAQSTARAALLTRLGITADEAALLLG